MQERLELDFAVSDIDVRRAGADAKLLRSKGRATAYFGRAVVVAIPETSESAAGRAEHGNGGEDTRVGEEGFLLSGASFEPKSSLK